MDSRDFAYAKEMEYDTASIAPSQAETLVSNDSLSPKRVAYSASGKIQPPYKPSGLACIPVGYHGAGFAPNMVQHVPFSFSDETLIYVSVVLGDDGDEKNTS